VLIPPGEGGTKTGFWGCLPGGFAIDSGEAAKRFFVLVVDLDLTRHFSLHFFYGGCCGVDGTLSLLKFKAQAGFGLLFLVCRESPLFFSPLQSPELEGSFFFSCNSRRLEVTQMGELTPAPSPRLQ
jgi:hypothetical protein